MTRGLTLSLTLSLLLAGAAAPAANADPIGITTGSIFLGPFEEDSFALLEGDGFALHINETLYPTLDCSRSPCEAGGVVNLSESNRTWGGGWGEIEIDGRLEAFSTSLLVFDITAGDATLAGIDQELLGSSEATFSFLARLTGTTMSGLPFSRELRGQGAAYAQVWFDASLFGDLEAYYTFEPAAPVPEPTTLLLLGSGLCGVALRRRRQLARDRRSGVPAHEV